MREIHDNGEYRIVQGLSTRGEWRHTANALVLSRSCQPDLLAKISTDIARLLTKGGVKSFGGQQNA